MYITCLDVEGVLVPEIWIAFAEASGIPELKKTTRDEPDYDKLMNWRLGILKEHGLGLKEIQEVIAKIDPLPGAKKFLDDGSFRSLKDNLAQKNGEEAFRAAHTLKGVCQNLGFDNLYKASFDITEKLRGRDTEGCEELLAKVEEQYNNTVDAIHMMED